MSITECRIYPPNTDGSIGINNANIYGVDEIIVDGSSAAVKGEDYSLNGAEWVNFGDKCGYIFPKEKSDNIGELKARWTEGVNSHFELWFSHGINPVGGQYAYIQTPGQSAEETKAFAKNNPIKILSNTPSLQAVEDTSLGIVSMVFWEAGSFGDITVSQPCIVMCKESDGEYRISISDPTQKRSSLTVKVSRSLEAADIDDEAVSTVENGITTIEIKPSKTTVGRTYENVFKSQSTKIYIKGKGGANIKPIIRNDRILVPVRFVSEGLNAKVDWSLDASNTGIVTVSEAGREIVIYVNSEKAYVDGTEQILESPAVIEGERAYVPLRFIAEALGASVEWDSQGMTATIIPADGN